jgi:hypothetical protein
LVKEKEVDQIFSYNVIFTILKILEGKEHDSFIIEHELITNENEYDLLWDIEWNTIRA